MRLPGEHLDSNDGIASPDGSHLVISNDLEPGSWRRFVLNPDGAGIRLLAEAVFGFDWAPDGSRIAFTEDHGAELRVIVAPAVGSTRSLFASLPNGPDNPYDLVIDADGSGDAVPIDDLTYESWRGGSDDSDCDLRG